MQLCWLPALTGPKVRESQRWRQIQRNGGRCVKVYFSMMPVLMGYVGRPGQKKNTGSCVSDAQRESCENPPSVGPSRCSHVLIWSSSPAHKELMVIHSGASSNAPRGAFEMCWNWRRKMVVTVGSAHQPLGERDVSGPLWGSDMMYEPWKAAQNRSEKRNPLFCES